MMLARTPLARATAAQAAPAEACAMQDRVDDPAYRALIRQPEPVATRLSRHIVGMRDGIDYRIAPVFTVDQLAACSNFGLSGRQLFCARLRQHLIGQSKIIRRTAVTRRDPHTCCGLIKVQLEAGQRYVIAINEEW